MNKFDNWLRGKDISISKIEVILVCSYIGVSLVGVLLHNYWLYKFHNGDPLLWALSLVYSIPGYTQVFLGVGIIYFFRKDIYDFLAQLTKMKYFWVVWVFFLLSVLTKIVLQFWIDDILRVLHFIYNNGTEEYVSLPKIEFRYDILLSLRGIIIQTVSLIASGVVLKSMYDYFERLRKGFGYVTLVYLIVLGLSIFPFKLVYLLAHMAIPTIYAVIKFILYKKFKNPMIYPVILIALALGTFVISCIFVVIGI